MSLPTINELLDSTTQAGIRAEFPKIKAAVNEALEAANYTDGSWQSEPINWADLKCADVEYVIDEHDGRFVATIEEASPGCPSLCNFVRKHLESIGLADVDVVTEW